MPPPPPPPLDETLRAQDLVMDGSVQENMLQAQLILNNQTGDSHFKIFRAFAYACIKLINILKNLGGVGKLNFRGGSHLLNEIWVGLLIKFID